MKALLLLLARCLLLAAAGWGAVQAAWAAETPRRVLMVLSRDDQHMETAFRDYLARQQVPPVVERLRFSGRAEDGPALVAQVREKAPDLIYSWGTGTTLALAGTYMPQPAVAAIRDIPIVFTEVTDPVAVKLLRQLNPPGRNVTGVSHVAPLAVQLNTLRSYRPFKRLGYIVNPKEPNTQVVLDALRPLVKSMGLEVVARTVPLTAAGEPDAAALPGLIQSLARHPVDVLYIGPSTLLALTYRDVVTQAALDAKLPTFCVTESVVRKAKCLVGLFSNGSNLGRFAAYKAVQVLQQQMPIEHVPAETLQRFSLLINMSVARQLALYPPLNLLNVAEVLP